MAKDGAIFQRPFHILVLRNLYTIILLVCRVVEAVLSREFEICTVSSASVHNLRSYMQRKSARINPEEADPLDLL